MNYFPVIIFIFIFLSVGNSINQLNNSDYNYLKTWLNRINKLADPEIALFWDSGTQLYDFCKLYTCSSELNNDGSIQFYLQSISLKNSTSSSTMGIEIMYSDFQNFNRLNSIELIGYRVSNDIFMQNVLKSSVTTLSLLNCSNVNIPTTIQPNITSLTIELSEPLVNNGGLLSVNVLSFLKTFIVKTTQPLPVGSFQYPNFEKISQIAGSQMDNFVFVTTIIPDLSLYTITNVSITVPYVSDISKLNTLVKVKNLMLDFQANPIDFPTLFTSTDNLIETLILKSTINSPPFLIDLARSKSLKSFTYVQKLSPPTPFTFGSTGMFPFSTLPTSLEEINFENAGVITFGNGSIFTNLKKINFASNKIVSALPASIPVPSLINLSLKNNSYYGTIPNTSYCNMIFDVSNNLKIEGELPQCFSCYIPTQPSVSQLFTGTQINLNAIKQENCTLKVIPNFSITNNKKFQLSGDNLGYEVPFSFSDVQLTNKQMVIPNKLFTGDILRGLDDVIVFTFMGSNYTLPTKSIEPNITQIFGTTRGSIQNEYQFVGKYFTYNESLVSITVNGYKCKVITTMFEAIRCGLVDANGTPVYITANQGTSYFVANVSISNFATIQLTISSISKISQVNLCKNKCNNGGICNTLVGNCVCSTNWIGVDCSTPDLDCPSNCTYPNGDCNRLTGVCSCTSKWNETDCSNPVPSCPDSCNNGVCNLSNNKCKCIPKWTGIDCLTPDLDCPSNCNSPNGVCDRLTGNCSCTSKWNTIDCSVPLPTCPPTCNNGICNNSTKNCECLPTWTGTDCLTRDFDCPNNCTYPNGDCNRLTGTCNCSSKWEDISCNTPLPTCPPTCNNGICNSNTKKCECLPTWTGADCLTRDFDCPNNCTYPNGDCNRLSGTCTCKSNWQSIDCIKPFKNCVGGCNEIESGSKCNNFTGECLCTSDYTGVNCLLPSQYISSIEPTTTDGGLVKMWGWFGKNNSDLSIQIGSSFCNVTFVNSSYITCEIGSDSGTKSVTVTQNGIKYTGNDIYHYTEITYKCPNDCSGHGTCNKLVGQCKCSLGWAGFDCNAKSTPSTGGTSSSTTTATTSTITTSSTTSQQTQQPTSTPEQIKLPDTVTTVNQTEGSALINNEKTTYEIKIISLVELGYDQSVVKANPLNNRWSVDTSIDNKFIFSQTLNNTNCEIIYSIEELKDSRDYGFAGLDLTLDKGSIKISVEIKNYPYLNSLNTLQLQMESKIGEINSNNNNDKENNNQECNKENTQIDTNQLDKNQVLNYVTISKDQKILYGRFINRVISDTKPTFITTSVIQTNQTDSLVIGVNLPHCRQSCLIDPDFSVLVSSNYQQCSSDENKNGRVSWVLPVAIVVPCVTVAAFLIIGSIVYRKNRTSILLAKEKYSSNLKKYSKKSNSELYMPD
ncbi:hypothetical protein ACTA71_000691 [Dictyostelium dimigraforme]